MTAEPDERVQSVAHGYITLLPRGPRWPGLPEPFHREKERLLSCLAGDMIGRIEHLGCDTVPGLSAKPVVDMLIAAAAAFILLELERLRRQPTDDGAESWSVL